MPTGSRRDEGSGRRPSSLAASSACTDSRHIADATLAASPLAGEDEGGLLCWFSAGPACRPDVRGVVRIRGWLFPRRLDVRPGGNGSGGTTIASGRETPKWSLP